MIVFPCHVCRTDLSAEQSQAGQLVRCRNCLTTLRVPAPGTVVASMSVEAGSGGAADPSRSAAAALHSMHQVAVAQSTGAAGDVGASAGAPSAGGYSPPPYPAPQSPPGTYMPVPPQQQAYYPPSAFNRPAVGRRYGFNCGFCSSRLEATESMAAQEGQCPTCGNTITIPILDRYGRLIDPKTNQIIKQDPHPVHAYAAAGDRAPQILRGPDGKQSIRCTRCGGFSVITANNCKGCGMPFTMEGTTLEAAGSSNGFAVASLVLGIIGIASCVVFVPSILAVIFGAVAMGQINKTGADKGGGKGMAIAGLVLGIIGCVLGMLFVTK